jgi:hypothetical protein
MQQSFDIFWLKDPGHFLTLQRIVVATSGS